MSEEREAAGALLGVVLDGSYRIGRLLGEGGMGAVYHATHLRLDKPVAVKVMARELASNQEALERFRREARVTSALGHPHIVQVFDFSTTPAGEPFLVMEYLDGEDLDHRLRRVGRLPVGEVVHIVKQVASALSATHAKAIVHRDLKPGNIYLLEVAGEKDFVKVLDFGISKVRSASTKLTRTSSVMGTPNYMSPEQAQGRIEAIDETTDQWALACIAWECLSGQGPFQGENVPSILFQVVHEPPPALASKVTGLPREVEEVLRCALAKEKGRRFASVAAFASALEAASRPSPAQPGTSQATGLPRTALDTGTEKQVVPPTTFTRTAGELDGDADALPPSSKRWAWAMAAGVAAALLVIAFLLLRPSQTSTPAAASPPSAIPAAAAAPAPATVAPPAALPPEASRDDKLIEAKSAPTFEPAKPARQSEVKRKSESIPKLRPAKKTPPSKKSEEDLDQWH